MANMSEEWRQSIVEMAYTALMLQVDVKGGTNSRDMLKNRSWSRCMVQGFLDLLVVGNMENHHVPNPGVGKLAKGTSILNLRGVESKNNA
jgi:hypothetical protein